ncbi:hypothetical protein [Pseudaestuariivita rosea]|uniref:hypothetical protein n=1 Tax=Pseudaestuariivita rosea TaxID=2763263 RepID=UPI001ABAA188|nr:hypothetical protein [Pseudaestuariivita rosea]
MKTSAAEEAKQRVADLSKEATEAIRDEAEHHAQQAQSAAAEEVESFSDAAAAAAAEFDHNSLQAKAAEQVANGLEQAASQIRSADLNDIVDNVSDFARRNPLVFLGGAALLGFAATRFLKARAPEPDYDQSDDPWITSHDHRPSSDHFDDDNYYSSRASH